MSNMQDPKTHRRCGWWAVGLFYGMCTTAVLLGLWHAYVLPQTANVTIAITLGGGMWLSRKLDRLPRDWALAGSATGCGVVTLVDGAVRVQAGRTDAVISLSLAALLLVVGYGLTWWQRQAATRET